MSGEPRERIVPHLDDPQVREMADRNHRPAEVWTMAGLLVSLHCDECGQPWPCATRQALKEQR